MNSSMSRRSFIQKSSLVIAVAVFTKELKIFNASSAYTAPMTFKPHAFVEISQDETVTVWLGQTNLGQGTHTGISMIIADELDADWNMVQARMALAADVFKNPHWHAQVTGGSSSIRHRWEMLRKAGATARQMLIQAAANRWNVNASVCKTEKGQVINPDGQSLSYGQLVSDAQKLQIPEDPPLKDHKDYNIIGTTRARLDIPDKVNGKTKYGIDTLIDNMCIAVVARPPRFGATPVSYDEKAATAVKGVLNVIPLEGRIAVCGETTYAALQGRAKLAVQWSEGDYPDFDDKILASAFTESLNKPGAIAETTGDSEKALASCTKIVESTYKLPYLSHAQLEPINCTAHVEKDRCRIWVPTQGQTAALMTAAAMTGLPQENIEVMTTPAGGGFGLRGETDPVKDAVELSKIIERPVKVMWTREDDFGNDYFRPGSIMKIKAGIDQQGKLLAWSQKVASPSIMTRLMPHAVQNDIDPSSIQGIPDMPYALPNRLVEYVMMDLPVPVGFWRSVGYSITTFTVETCIDQLADAAGRDPVEFRLELLEKDSRNQQTLSLLAEKCNWGGAVPDGRSRGIALGSCFGSSAAHMVELSVDTHSGQVTIHRIECSVDCGPAIYPDAIKAQMEGAAVMALSVAFNERVHFAQGGVKTTNFDQYPLLTLAKVPEIKVHIADSVHEIGGIGEPGIPTVAPAVANALFKATGIMLTELPFDLTKLAQS